VDIAALGSVIYYPVAGLMDDDGYGQRLWHGALIEPVFGDSDVFWIEMRPMPCYCVHSSHARAELHWRRGTFSTSQI